MRLSLLFWHSYFILSATGQWSNRRYTEDIPQNTEDKNEIRTQRKRLQRFFLGQRPMLGWKVKGFAFEVLSWKRANHVPITWSNSGKALLAIVLALNDQIIHQRLTSKRIWRSLCQVGLIEMPWHQFFRQSTFFKLALLDNFSAKIRNDTPHTLRA